MGFSALRGGPRPNRSALWQAAVGAAQPGPARRRGQKRAYGKGLPLRAPHSITSSARSGIVAPLRPSPQLARGCSGPRESGAPLLALGARGGGGSGDTLISQRRRPVSALAE